jgi:hypothetical protein
MADSTVELYRSLYEFGLALGRVKGVKTARVVFKSGAVFVMEGGAIAITYDDRTLTLDQLPGLIEALERDAPE